MLIDIRRPPRLRMAGVVRPHSVRARLRSQLADVQPAGKRRADVFGRADHRTCRRRAIAHNCGVDLDTPVGLPASDVPGVCGVQVIANAKIINVIHRQGAGIRRGRASGAEYASNPGNGAPLELTLGRGGIAGPPVWRADRQEALRPDRCGRPYRKRRPRLINRQGHPGIDDSMEHCLVAPGLGRSRRRGADHGRVERMNRRVVAAHLREQKGEEKGRDLADSFQAGGDILGLRPRQDLTKCFFVVGREGERDERDDLAGSIQLLVTFEQASQRRETSPVDQDGGPKLVREGQQNEALRLVQLANICLGFACAFLQLVDFL